MPTQPSLAEFGQTAVRNHGLSFAHLGWPPAAFCACPCMPALAFMCFGARRSGARLHARADAWLIDIVDARAAPLRLRKPVSFRAPLSGELSLAPWRCRSHAAPIYGRGCCGGGNAGSRSLHRGHCIGIHRRLVVNQALGTAQGREPATLPGRRRKPSGCRHRCRAPRRRAQWHLPAPGAMARTRGTSSSAAANACSTARAFGATACPRSCRPPCSSRCIATPRGSCRCCRCTAVAPAAAPSHNCRGAAHPHRLAFATSCRPGAAVEVGQGSNSRARCP